MCNDIYFLKGGLYMLIRKNADGTISVIAKTEVITFSGPVLKLDRLMVDSIIIQDTDVVIGHLKARSVSVRGFSTVKVKEIPSDNKMYVNTQHAVSGSVVMISGKKLNLPDRKDEFNTPIEFKRLGESRKEMDYKDYDDSILSEVKELMIDMGDPDFH